MNNHKNTSVNFENQVFYIGIDVHKNSWAVTIRSNNMVLKTFSMNPSPQELALYLKQNYPSGIYRAVYEAGFCGFWIHNQLLEHGIENIVTHAADVPTTHKEKVTKTDKVDSKKLAKELECHNLKAIYVPSVQAQQIRSLCRLRHKISCHIGRLKNRIKGHLHYYGIKIPDNLNPEYWPARFIHYLLSLCEQDNPGSAYLRICIEEMLEQRKRLLEVTKLLRHYLLSSTNDVGRIISYLRSVPGIGFLSAATLYTEIITIERFSTLDHLASFVGLCPSCNSSGEKDITTGITPRRNLYLRHLIIEAAWIAARKDPVLLKSFNALSRRMKKTQAIVRIARKLLNRIRYVWLNNTEYKCFVN